jgi:Protein of unknown function (DUF3489)
MPTKPRKPARKSSHSAKASTKTPAKRPTRTKPNPVPTGTKQSQLLAVLRSPAGGTIEQLTTLTGWQPHTVRGTISGVLRKRLQLNVTCAAEESGTRVYRIVEAA